MIHLNSVPLRARFGLAAAALAVTAAAASCVETSSRHRVGARTAPSASLSATVPELGPCATTSTPPRYRHVVEVVMENRSYDEILGVGGPPYLRALAAGCAVLTGLTAETHPSLPNYLAMVSGSTWGIGDDAGPVAHQLPGPSLFGALGDDWRVLAESMPAPCATGDGGSYAVRHNPALYFTDAHAACGRNDLPLGDQPDLSAAFTLVVPNLCHDMHDCSTAQGDAWLAREIPVLTASPQYRAGNTVIIINWDEDDRSASNRIAGIVVAPSVRRGTTVSTPVNHYALLRTTEALLGLSPPLGAAASAPDLCRPLGLCR